MGWPDPSSTRWQGVRCRPTVEAGLRLDVHRMVRAAGLDAPGRGAGTWGWGDPPGSRGWITYDVEISGGEGSLLLDVHLGGSRQLQGLPLVGLPCRFGGRRWFAICPATRARVAKLYTGGGGVFRSRQALGLAYASQNEGTDAGAIARRISRLEERLGGEAAVRPKRMRWNTFERLLGELQRERAAYARAFSDNLAKILARHGRAWGPDL